MYFIRNSEKANRSKFLSCPLSSSTIVTMAADPVVETKQRRFWTLNAKISLCIKCEREVCAEKCKSFSAFCRENKVDPAQLRRWRRDIIRLQRMADQSSASKKTLSTGRPSSINDVSSDIIPWIHDLREQGITVSVRMVVLKISKLKPDFRRRNPKTKYGIVKRFLDANNIVIRKKTHEAQAAPEVHEGKAKAFILTTRTLLQGPHRHKKYIINMDQTAVYFSMTPGTTLEKRGAKSVNVRSSSGSTMRLTACLGVTADGHWLKPLFIFKGKEGGRIERDFRTFPMEAEYAVHEKSWTNIEIMLKWVERCLKPWVESAPDGVVPYLLLDSFKVHQTQQVVQAIEETGCELDFIPGGCTGLAQPLDVGINKPFKNRIRGRWEQYMVDVGVHEAFTKPPSRATITDWMLESMACIPEGMIKNAWLHGDYSYFPDQAKATYDSGEDYDEETQVIEQQEIV